MDFPAAIQGGTVTGGSSSYSYHSSAEDVPMWETVRLSMHARTHSNRTLQLSLYVLWD